MFGKFNGRLVTEPVGRFVWRTTEPLTFGVGEVVIAVPAGFLTDFASVPRMFWSILPLSDGQYDAAAVVHDFAVRSRRLLKLSLPDCHRIFHAALRAKGVPAFRAEVMYRAVWCFNWLMAGPGDGTTPKSLLRRVAK